MAHTRDEVLASARMIFGESRLAEALAALDEYGTGNDEREVNRVQLAILQLSEGRMEKLLHWVRAAKVDYRDPPAAREPGPLSPEEGAKFRADAKALIERWGRK